MSMSGDSAEQVVRISFEGVEYAFRIVGKGVEGLARIAALIAASLKDEAKDSPGKKTMREMMRSRRPIKFFEIPNRDLKEFVAQAKKYGITYAVGSEASKDPNAIMELVVAEEDVSKVNRIIERFKLAAVENGQVDVEQPPEPERGVQEKSENERLLDEIVQPQENSNRNPTAAKTEPASPSEPSSRERDSAERDEKPSVRERIQEIREAQKAAKTETPQIEVPHIEPKAPDR